uniref:Major capsid protein n=1 Tax=Dulem virus 86 TaxID=3145797 RepID=A0AAU8AZN5_9VIRU
MSIFNQIRIKVPKSNGFNLSHEVKQTQDFADLVPCYTEMIYPGDKFRVNTDILVKSLPMVAPLMHRIDVYVHYFFVPMRLIMGDWEEFVTGYDQGTAKALPTLRTVPKYVVNAQYSNHNLLDQLFGVGSLWNYLGFPAFSSAEYKDSNGNCVVKIPKYLINAYRKIYNDYYRDQNLDPELSLDMTTTDTNITLSSSTLSSIAPLVALQRRCWRKDYFTSALPDAQQGPPVNIMPNTSAVSFSMTTQDANYPFTSSPRPAAGTVVKTTNSGSNQTNVGLNVDDGTSKLLKFDVSKLKGTVTHDAVTVNTLRQQLRLQTWLEKLERSGHRYAELLPTMFGVRSDDARLQRVEFLGGGRQPVVVTEIQNHTYTNSSGAPLGKQGGTSISAGSQSGFRRRFKEHGIMMCIMSIVPAAGYFQGLPRKFLFETKNDMFWHEFAHLGEQVVQNKELWYNFRADSTKNDAEFGYQSRYAELKRNQDRIAGLFAKTDETSLFYWTLARYFTPQSSTNNIIQSGTTVNLNPNFMHIDKDSLRRCFAIISDQPNNQPFYVQMYHNVRALRKMPKFGTPTL